MSQPDQQHKLLPQPGPWCREAPATRRSSVLPSPPTSYRRPAPPRRAPRGLRGPEMAPGPGVLPGPPALEGEKVRRSPLPGGKRVPRAARARNGRQKRSRTPTASRRPRGCEQRLPRFLRRPPGAPGRPAELPPRLRGAPPAPLPAPSPWRAPGGGRAPASAALSAPPPGRLRAGKRPGLFPQRRTPAVVPRGETGAQPGSPRPAAPQRPSGGASTLLQEGKESKTP